MKLGAKLKKHRGKVVIAATVASAAGVGIVRPDKVIQGYDALAALLALL